MAFWTTRRGRAVRVLTQGIALGALVALLRVDLYRLNPTRGALLRGEPMAGAASDARTRDEMVKRELDVRVDAEVKEIIERRDRAAEEANAAVEESPRLREVHVDDDPPVETSPPPPPPPPPVETSPPPPPPSPLPSPPPPSPSPRVISDTVTSHVERRNEERTSNASAASSEDSYVAAAPSFMEPFALRAINGRRTDAFAVDDSRPNRCEPKRINRRIWGSARSLDFIVPRDSEEWPQNCDGREALCEVLRRVAKNREVLAAVANSQAPGLTPFLEMLIALKVPNFLVIALDEPLTKRLDELGVPYYFHEDPVMGNHKVSAKKFALIQEFVAVGCSVLLTDTDVTYQQNPFDYLYRDSDIESMSDGFDNDSANGFLQPIDDVSFGEARRRAGSFRVAALNSGMWYVSATEASLRLMKIMAHRLATEELWDQSGYNLELWFASRDAHMTSGATVRVMDPFCFMNSKVMFRIIRHSKPLQRENHRPVAMHANYHTDKDNKIKLVHAYYTKDAPLSSLDCTTGCDKGLKSIIQLESGHLHSINDGFIGSKTWTKGRAGAKTCEPMTAWDGKVDKLDRKLHVISDSERVCRSDSKLRKTVKEICDVLSSKLTFDEHGDAMIVVADAKDSEVFGLFLEHGIEKNRLIKRAMVVTDDESIAKAARDAGVATVIRKSQKTPLSKAALKWYAIHAVLRDGHGVVFVDPRVVLLDDPSKFFYRDSDLESASDGWDDASAYGYDHVVDDPTMDWSRFLHGGRVVSSDAGFFRLSPTQESIAFAERMATRLTAMKGDVSVAQEQDVFNAAVFFPSYGDVVAVGILRRTLNYLCFANSKTVFLFMRKDQAMAKHVPITVDFSYHVRDVERMRDTYAYYEALKSGESSEVQKSRVPFMKWAAGTGVETSGEESIALCAVPTSAPTKSAIESHELASKISNEREREWSWAGTPGMKFLEAGKLATPWGEGKWALVTASDGNVIPNALWADFAGTHHLLKFETPEGSDAENSMFVSERCGDGSLVVGRLLPVKVSDA
jgi:outer membrane biosynthesis protein TonB/rRNA-processing protein FCF1